MSASANDEHLDPLALDSLRAGEGSAEERAHLEGCAWCREEIHTLERLSTALKGRSMGAGEVPPEVDRAVLALARSELARARPRKILRFRAPLAAAAALVLATGAGLWIASLTLWSPRGLPGRVDIVDAYTLALRIRSGGALSSVWDANRDGAVDGRDVEEIARRSVSLSEGSR